MYNSYKHPHLLSLLLCSCKVYSRPLARLSVWLLPAILFPVLGWAQGNPIGKPSTTELLEIDANFQRNDAARIDWADVLPGAPGVVHPGANPLTRSIWVVDGNSGSSSTKLEKEVFRGSSNKNGDNIASGSSPYAIETSSPSAPQKNDLTNIYAHTRRIGADQWLMFGAETRSTDGASYLDFEYNQAGIAATATQLTGNGLHSGRTVGDLLIIVNYENGGSAPAVETRRWEATNKPNQPYDWSEPVAIPSNSTNLFVVANGAAVPPAAPNTAFTGDGATANVTASLQLVEGSVNLTALGLLPPSTCDRGATMLVKTRTSPSYTSELKDFSLFDFSLTAPGLPTANGAEYCVGSQASALTASGLPGATLLWYTDATGGTGAATAPVPSTTTAGTSTYYVSQVLNGCEGARLPVQVVVREAAGAAAGPDQMVCSTTTSVLLSGSVSGSATSGTWSGGHGSFADANALNTTYTFAAADIEAGSVTLTLTTNDPAGPCGAVADQVVITINRAAVADAGKDQEVCASALPVTLAGQVSGGANSGTWSGGTGMFANASALNTTYSPSAAEIQAGTVTLTLTSNDPDGPCDAVADNVTIRILPAVSTQAGPDQTVCASVPVALQGSVSGGATTGVWTSSGTGTFSPSATSLTATYTPSAADVLAGSVKLTLTSADPTGPCPSTTDDLVVTIQGCATKHCTLTQGGYGNAMGKICSGPIRLDLLNNTLLTTPLKVGAGANTLTYVSGQGQCLIDKLPAGGTAGAMNAGALTGCSIPSGMLKNGKFNNVLLGQTLALALNLRLDPTLGAVRLPATGVFTTYAASSCTATAPTVNLLDVKTATIPASVRTYLGSNANVDSILSLANKAIGGLYKPATGKPSYADINQAVSGINEVFDNCRMQLDASAPSASLTQTSSTMQSALRTAPGTPVLYPNPTTQDATLEFSVGQPQPYSLEVYDMQGRRVEKTVYGLTEASGTQSVTFGRSLPEGVYLVRLITTGATTTLRLVKRP